MVFTPTVDGERASKGPGSFLNGSNVEGLNFREIALREVTDIGDLTRRLLDPNANQDELRRDLRSALVRDENLAAKREFEIPGLVGRLTLGEIANRFNKPAIGQWLNNLAEGSAYDANETEYPDLDALHAADGTDDQPWLSGNGAEELVME